MAKVHSYISENEVLGKGLRHLVFCPGCNMHHSFDERWTYNGDPEKPTFSPSLLCNPDHVKIRCHSFIRDGQWQFLSDCYHELAGKTVDMIDVNF